MLKTPTVTGHDATTNISNQNTARTASLNAQSILPNQDPCYDRCSVHHAQRHGKVDAARLERGGRAGATAARERVAALESNACSMAARETEALTARGFHSFHDVC